MKKFYSILMVIFFCLFSVSCSNSNEIIGSAQYIEHGSPQLYTGTDKYGVIYINLGDQYIIGDVESYAIEDIDIEDIEKNSSINTAEEFNFKNSLLCIPLNNSGVSDGDTLVFKHNRRIIGNLEVVTM